MGITIAIGALVYVWVQGFGGFGAAAPAADAKVLSCNVAADAVTARLSTGKNLETSDLGASLVNLSSGTAEGRASSLTSGPGSWEVRTRLTIADHEDDEPRWDAALASPGGLAPETRYEFDWHHRPSSTVFPVDRFTCGPQDAPEPLFDLTSCGAQNDEVTVRLSSDRALELDRWRADLVNRSDGATEATADPLDDEGIWRPGSARTLQEAGQGGGLSWDSDLSRSLEDGGRYRIDFTYLPTGTRQASLDFVC